MALRDIIRPRPRYYRSKKGLFVKEEGIHRLDGVVVNRYLCLAKPGKPSKEPCLRRMMPKVKKPTVFYENASS